MTVRAAGAALAIAMAPACSGGAGHDTSAAASPPAVAATASGSGGLRAAKSHALVLSNVGENGAADLANLGAIGASAYDVVTIDEVGTAAAPGKLAMRDVLARVRASRGGRTVLGYVNIGEAEAWRAYFESTWKIGSPTFILAADPDGFAGDYPVLFTDPRWRSIVYGTAASLVDRAIDDGFDGVYMDWAAAFQFAPVLAADPSARSDMIAFVEAISAYAKGRKPGFLIVPQNVADLLSDAGFVAAIDAVGQEDLWFTNDGRGDVATPTAGVAATIAQLDTAHANGLPVLGIDYAREPANVARAYAAAARHGFLEYVGARSLQRLTATPPQGL